MLGYHFIWGAPWLAQSCEQRPGMHPAVFYLCDSLPPACPLALLALPLQKNGAHFEAVVRAREARNPRFAFLQPTHRHNCHYR